jgi:hypothetical protein
MQMHQDLQRADVASLQVLDGFTLIVCGPIASPELQRRANGPRDSATGLR